MYDATTPDLVFDFDKERAEVDGSLSACLSTFRMGAFRHIQGAYENARENISTAVKRRVTLTRASHCESKKGAEPRRPTGSGERANPTSQNQDDSRLSLQMRSREVVEISDSDEEIITPAPARNSSKDDYSKRNKAMSSSAVEQRSSTSSQKSQAKERRSCTLQQRPIHEEPDNMESEGAFMQETYPNRPW
ncbi:hypothetical protein NLJ89_g10820 [Agrocybe chaxingu]|uniref:Uncharacterized protein n=1 Tax=Agrocybe chaxingu TaxID=84603 RepID=A0A9W8JR22_9AGAR|nr:hypothetical protein NLJ89_g10820 [Agrocybe chaxingu]